jgi:beclin 1
VENKQSVELLLKLEKESSDLKLKLLEAEKEMKKMDETELRYWDNLNDLEVNLLAHHDEISNLNSQFEEAEKQLNYLSKTNVFQDAFRINYEGQFGTINSLRLGRLPNLHVITKYITIG